MLYREGGLSIAALAMLHQTLGITRNTLERILMEKRSFRENLRTVKAMYQGAEKMVQDTPEEGVQSGTDEKTSDALPSQDDVTSSEGIGLELR